MHVELSMARRLTALEFALKNENLKAARMLAPKKDAKKERAPMPVSHLESSGTGIYNYRYCYSEVRIAHTPHWFTKNRYSD